MSEGERWIEFRPRWAQHVVGRYTERTIDPETQQPEPQRWSALCEQCKATHGPATCDSGMVRNHIANFAILHAHRDPLKTGVPPKREPPPSG